MTPCLSFRLRRTGPGGRRLYHGGPSNPFKIRPNTSGRGKAKLVKGTLAQLILLRQVMEACQETSSLKPFTRNGSAGFILGHIVSQSSPAPFLLRFSFEIPQE